MRAGYLFGLAALAITFGSTAADAAMCGRTCGAGGRYFPGPPEVCAANGLLFCGRSRRGPAVVVPPTVVTPGVVIGGGRRERDCRTTTIRRPDGTTITRRECH